MITRENAKDWLPLVQALADCKRVVPTEVRNKYGAPVDENVLEPEIAGPECYRIASLRAACKQMAQEKDEHGKTKYVVTIDGGTIK